MKLVAIAGIAKNSVIGNDGEVPWDIPADKAFYRSAAAGHPLLIGRKTFSGVKVEDADYIVMSRSSHSYDDDRVHAVQSATEALEKAEELLEEYDNDTVCNLGGAEIYDLFLPYTNEMLISHIHEAYEGDTVFPDWDKDNWTVLERESFEEFEAVHYEQKNPKPIDSFDE